MDLNQMEANDGMAEDEQVDDLWVTLSSMGFADDLQLDEVTIRYNFWYSYFGFILFGLCFISLGTCVEFLGVCGIIGVVFCQISNT